MATVSSKEKPGDVENGSRLRVQSEGLTVRSMDNLNNPRGLTPVESHPLMMQLSPTGSSYSDEFDYSNLVNNASEASNYPDLVPESERNHNNDDFAGSSSTAKSKPSFTLELNCDNQKKKKKTPLQRFSSSGSDEESSQYQATVGPSLDRVLLVSSKGLASEKVPKPPPTMPESSSPETPSPTENRVPSPASSIFDDLEVRPEETKERDRANWVKVQLPDGKCREIDMKVIEPYKRILSHGGYYSKQNAIIVFSSCFLPDRSRSDYHYVMANLFLYVIKTLQQLITDDYVLVYFHGGGSSKNNVPFRWLKKCYQLIDRRLRKSLKAMYLVHPSFWLKSYVWMLRPFVSTKFWRKMVYVQNLDELYKQVNVEKAAVPDVVVKYNHKLKPN